jgi:S-DNA-T family DNA segregation ATPase FtsK/SpoIIIE
VAINTLLTSLLMNFTPDDLRLILVDPKMVELQPYDGIPHLYLPVVTDMKHAASALRWAVDEMERRYQLFSDRNVRDIRSFNRKVDKLAEAETPTSSGDDGAGEEGAASETPQPERLPYVVIVIDEFADLMMTSARDVEMAVSRLAAKARAAGIHLIVATQRPSVNVVTGLIKSNFPCRIAFKVASKVDSRIMLDANGAESLLGMGDMLILPPGQSELKRMHGAFISDEEIHAITDMWRQQADPTYCEEILKAGDDDEGLLRDEEEDLDPRYNDAVAIAVNEGKVSISYLQRKLKIGYNRAARIVEKMEADGIVGPSVPGRSHREVLVPSATG